MGGYRDPSRNTVQDTACTPGPVNSTGEQKASDPAYCIGKWLVLRTGTLHRRQDGTPSRYTLGETEWAP